MKSRVAFKKLEKLAQKTNIKDYVDLEEPHVEADRILIKLKNDTPKEAEKVI